MQIERTTLPRYSKILGPLNPSGMKPGVFVSEYGVSERADRGEAGRARPSAFVLGRLPLATASDHRWLSTSPALPAGIWIVDASVETLGVEPVWIRHTEHDHLPSLRATSPSFRLPVDIGTSAKRFRLIQQQPNLAVDCFYRSSDGYGAPKML
jgi:hypothetical protein